MRILVAEDDPDLNKVMVKKLSGIDVEGKRVGKLQTLIYQGF